MRIAASLLLHLHPFAGTPISQRRRIPSSAYAAQIDSRAAAGAAASSAGAEAGHKAEEDVAAGSKQN